MSLSLVTAHAPAARGSHAPRRALQAPRIRRGSSRPDARRPRPWVDCGGSIATNEEVRRDRGNSWTGARIRINPIMPNQAPETSVLCSVWIVAGFGRSRWPWTDVVAADWVATPPSPKMSKRGGCQLAASPPPIPFALSVPSGRPPKRGVSCGGRLARSSLAQPSAAAAPPPGSCLPALPRRRRPAPPARLEAGA